MGPWLLVLLLPLLLLWKDAAGMVEGDRHASAAGGMGEEARGNEGDSGGTPCEAAAMVWCGEEDEDEEDAPLALAPAAVWWLAEGDRERARSAGRLVVGVGRLYSLLECAIGERCGETDAAVVAWA